MTQKKQREKACYIEGTMVRISDMLLEAMQTIKDSGATALM